MKGVFVTGSNTGVGKTTVAVEVVRHISLTREVRVRKPVETDCEFNGKNHIPKDAIALSDACEQQEPLDGFVHIILNSRPVQKWPAMKVEKKSPLKTWCRPVGAELMNAL